MKKSISWILIPTTIIVFVCCCSTTNQLIINQSEIEIIESRKENWHSGAKPGYHGTDYFITLVMKTNHPITFDSLWTGNKSAKIKTLKNDIRINNASEISKGDTLKLRATVLKTSSDRIKILPPVNSTPDQAIISIITDRKTKYLKVDNFELIKGPLRP